MKLLVPFILCLLFTRSNIIFDSDDNGIEYFPLKVGNVYVYNVKKNYAGNVSYYILKATVDRDTVIMDRKYFFCKNFPKLSQAWYRVDSASGNLYEYDVSIQCSAHVSERLIDSLSADNSALFSGCGGTQDGWCTREPVSLFGNTVQQKTFSRSYNFGSHFYSNVTYYAEDFGMNSFVDIGEYVTSNSTRYTLKGCVLNDSVYGDTSAPVDPPIPPSYSLYLYPNFPNPFNPATTIRYEIPSKRKVNLSVFDSLGRLVNVIINEEQSAGIYEYNFDGSGLASGVYIYRLFADTKLIDSKRMILLK